MMEIYIEKQSKTVKVSRIKDAKALLEKLQINPDTVLVVRNGKVILPDEKLDEKDKIKLISVVSGG